MLSVSPRIHIPDNELQFTFVRSSGPGGQNVNKLNTKAVMRWAVRASSKLPADARARFMERYGHRLTNDGELVISSERFRNQSANQRDCIEKLRDLLMAIARPPKVRRKTKPTRSSIERRRTGKRIHSQKKRHRRGPLIDD